MIDLTYYYYSILLTLLNVHRSIATVEMHSLTAVDITAEEKRIKNIPSEPPSKLSPD